MGILASQWPVPTHCGGSLQAADLIQFLCCYVFQFKVLNSVLIFKALSAEQFLWDHQEATVQSALLERFLNICLLRWSSTTGFAHPPLDNARQIFLEVFGYNVIDNWSNQCDHEFNLKKSYVEENTCCSIFDAHQKWWGQNPESALISNNWKKQF